MRGPHGGVGQFVQFGKVYAVTSISSSDARHAPAGHTRARLPPRPYISPPMTRRFTRLAWTAATFTYLLIILGAIVPITRSGLGCGEHWPLCNGKLLPPLDLPTMIDRKSTRLNSSHGYISYAVFCLKKKKKNT